MATFNWGELMKILEEQTKINKVIRERLEKVETRLVKLEKKPRKKKEET